MDLAKLVVRLELQSAQLQKELEKTNAKLAGFEKRVKGFGSSIKGALAVFAGAVTLRKVIDASAEAAKNFANLENAVVRAGDAAGGRSARDFEKISEQLQNVTTFSDDAIQGVQQLLLRFQNIRTDRFDDATKRVLDLSIAMGTDAPAAAKLLGRALSDPEKGMTALARAGIVFSERQKKVIKDLTDTGRQAEAQGIILDELAKKFGGAAEAARNNFAGALAGVKNAFDNLLEINGGLPEATKQLNDFAELLADPSTKQAADSLFSGIVVAATTATSAVAKFVEGIRLAAGGEGTDKIVNVGNELRRLQKLKEEFDAAMAPGLRRETGGFFGLLTSAEEARAQIKGLNVLIADTEKDLADLVNNAGKKAGAGAASGAQVLPDITVFDGLSEAAEKAQKQLESAGKAMTESLLTPLEKTQKSVAEADKLLAANVITLETWRRAVTAAAEDLDPLLGALATAGEAAHNFDAEIEAALAKPEVGLADAIQESTDEAMKKTLDGLDKTQAAAAKKLEAFSDQAARNTQDILATGLEEAIHGGVESGVEGALEAFGKMLERMALQAVAANLAKKLFGSTEDGSVGGGGGLIDKAIEAAGTFFSNLGSRDSGGRGMAGVPVMIGSGAQPEVFVPDSAGDFFPRGQWSGGGGSVTQNIYTNGPITQRSARQLELEAARRQRIAQARLG